MRGNSKNYGKRKRKKKNRHIGFMEKLYNTSSRRIINKKKVILNDSKLSETKKKELLKTLKNVMIL